MTHLLTEKVRAEIQIREKTQQSNKQIISKAEEDIYEILNNASIKIKDRPPEIIMQSIGGQLVSTKLSEIDKNKKLKIRESDHLD